MAETSKGIVYPDNYNAVADVPEDMKDMADSINGIIVEIDNNISNMQTDISNAQTAISGKVDKVTGKGLSTEDYTTAEKTKLAGIQAGATNTVIDSSLSTSSTNPVQSKAIKEALDTKVDKISGKGLSTNDYTTAEKTKLAGLSNYDDTTLVARVTELETENEDLKEQIEDLQNNQLTGTASGTSIDLNDSADSRVKEIAGYGNSVQDGTPTPESPVEIKSAGDSGNLGVLISPNHLALNVPSEYKQIEYIKSSGTQYIDTGVYPTGNTRLIAKVADFPKTSQTALFGQRTAPNVDSFSFLSVGTNNYRDDYNTNVQELPTDFDDIFTIDKNKNITTLTSARYTRTINHNVGTFTSNSTLILFGTHSNPTTVSSMSTAKYYYCKIYENDVLIRNFVPVKRRSDNEIGLYDLVNNVFYTKSGTGTFIAGEEIEVQIATIPCQQPMRSIGDVKDEFVKANGVWKERHNISYIASYNNETITTDYMSTTGELSTGASVQYVSTTPTDLVCNQSQITALEALQKARTYKTVTHIYSEDETAPNVDLTYYKDRQAYDNDILSRLEALESEG